LAYCISKFKTRVVYLAGITDRQMEEFAEHPVRHLINLSGREKWIELHEDETILTLLELLSNINIHRVAVVDRSGQVKDVISQSYLIQFLYAHHEHFHFGLDKLISDFPFQ